jgi:ATP-binding cassette subfamily B protein
VTPLFRPYRGQVAVVVGLIVLTSTIGIINPLLIQAVFNKALFAVASLAGSTVKTWSYLFLK